MTARIIGYGAMQLTGPNVWGPPADWSAAVRLLRLAYEWGVRLIDTAWYYGPHVTQELIAAALHPYPSDLVLVTKAGNSRRADRSWAPALSPTELRKACETDLGLLRLETLPLVLLRWNPTIGDDDAFAEALGTMLDLQSEGSVAGIGLSNVGLRHLHLAQTMTPVAAVSNAFSLDNRSDAPVLARCAAEGIPYLAYYPLLGGDVVRQPPVQRAARALAITPAQVAIAWLCAQSPWVVPIPGTRSETHLRENIDAQSLAIPDALLTSLEAEVRPDLLG